MTQKYQMGQSWISILESGLDLVIVCIWLFANAHYMKKRLAHAQVMYN